MSALERNGGISYLMLVVTFAVFLVSCDRAGLGARRKLTQRSFAAPQAAGDALFEAAKSGDQSALMAVFGPEGNDFVFSGDAVKDKNAMQFFVDAYRQMNRWSTTKSGDDVLYIGSDNFAFPIPLSRQSSGQWAFNTAAGKDEVLARRIGDGELTAIGILTEVANAQQEYFAEKHAFAEKFVSDENQHNGLYWPVPEGQRPSPLGYLVDQAKALGYSEAGKSQPFNGYFYKILTQQGEEAKGGAKDYVVDGKLKGGFAVLAWPAKYRDSGVMTFLVGKDGIVYEKDLRQDTGEAAAGITTYDPGDGWAIVLAPDPAHASL